MSTAQEVITVQSGPMQPVPVQSESAAIISMIERAARDPAVDVDKLRQLMEMREKVEARQAEREFDAAMTAVQNSLRRIRADAANPQTRSKYASYAALDRAVRPIYTGHGLALSFNTGDSAPEGHVRVICRVSHMGGYSRIYHIDMPADGKGAKGGDVMTKTHAAGSAVSYGMRYLLKMIFNLAVGEDDDGNAAGDTNERISPEQIEALQSAIVEAGADIPRFLKYFKIKRLEDLPASKVKRAFDMLQAKMATEATGARS